MGEKLGDRAVMDGVTKDLIAASVPVEKAKRLARESMARVDRKLRRAGKR